MDFISSSSFAQSSRLVLNECSLSNDATNESFSPPDTYEHLFKSAIA